MTTLLVSYYIQPNDTLTSWVRDMVKALRPADLDLVRRLFTFGGSFQEQERSLF